MSFEDNFFENNAPQSPLYEMGNSWANNSPFENGSQFYTDICGDFKNETVAGVTEYGDLISLLQNPYDKLFDQSLYTKKVFRLSDLEDSDYTPPFAEFETDRPSNDLKAIDNPFPYEENGVEKTGRFEYSILNTRVCYLDPVYSYEIKVNPYARELRFAINVYYANTAQYRVNETDIGDGLLTANISDKYRAIKLVTSNVSIFYSFIKLINRDKNDSIQRYLFNEFKSAYSSLNRSDLEAITWFYDNTPDFILYGLSTEDFWYYDQSNKQVVQGLSKEDLWQDLEALLLYEATSWFVNNDNNMLRVIKAIDVQDPKNEYLYDKFRSNPILIKKVYNSLRAGDNNNQLVLAGTRSNNYSQEPSKTVFAAIITAICYNYHTENDKAFDIKASFSIVKDKKRVNSDILVSDSEPGKFDLAQEEYRAVGKPKTINLGDNISPDFKRVQDYDWVTIDPNSYHPMAMVVLTLKGEGNSTIEVKVPAIMVKDIAYNAEWERVMYAVRIAGDVAAVIFGVVTLATTGNPLLIALAIADVGIGYTDLIAQTLRDDLLKTEWGRAFLNAWDEIYNYGSLLLAVANAPYLVRGLLQTGGQLWRTSKNLAAATRNFIKATLVKVILEINIQRGLKNLRKVEIGAEVLQAAPIRFSSRAAEELEKAGVIFAKLEDSDGMIRYTAFYKGEELVEATTAEKLRDELSGVWTARKGRILEGILDDLLHQKTGTGGFLQYKKIISRDMIGQSHKNSCGPACIKVLADENNFKSPLTGLPYTEEEIQILANTTRENATNLIDFSAAFEKIFQDKTKMTQFFRDDINEAIGFLKSRPNDEIPWITFIAPKRFGSTHTIIVDKIIGDEVFIRDPWPNGSGAYQKGKAGVVAVADIEEFAIQWQNGLGYRIKVTK